MSRRIVSRVATAALAGVLGAGVCVASGSPARADTVTPAVTIGVGAGCDGSTGTWWVMWSMKVVGEPVTIVSAADPVNGVTLTPPTFPVSAYNGPLRVPGTASVAALSVTVALPGGPSTTQTRSVPLGDACTVQTPQPCPTGQVAQAELTESATLASAVVPGPCFANAFQLLVRMPDPEQRQLVFAAGKSPVPPALTRVVLAADLPPCGWVATVAGTVRSGGSGVCVDDTVAVQQACRSRFTLTLHNGADAILATTFTVVTATDGSQTVSTYRTLAPGQSTVLTVGPSPTVIVLAWGAQLGVSAWAPRPAPSGALVLTHPLMPGRSACQAAERSSVTLQMERVALR